MRVEARAIVCLLLLPSSALAQGSEFGVRALGLPVVSTSARAQGMAGGFGLFDPEAGLNPASLGGILASVATFNVRQFWRASENPTGVGRGTDMQFPLMFVAGPVGSRWVVGLSVSALLDRTFAVAFRDTVEVRGERVAVDDTLASRGGLSDLRAGVAYRPNEWLTVGVGLHLVTGLNRIEFRRAFASPDYASVLLIQELSAAGQGASVGVLFEPSVQFRLAAMARVDSDLRLVLDSVRVATQPMPSTLGLGLGWQPSLRLSLHGHVRYQNWSVADSSIRARGGVGARSTIETAAGIEWIRNTQRPFTLPFRAGVRYRQLPFPLVPGTQPQELAVAAGTGIRFAGGRASVDLALERSWRSDRGAYRERNVGLAVGVGVRP
jgi:long-subunit fatty acid transport protein